MTFSCFFSTPRPQSSIKDTYQAIKPSRGFHHPIYNPESSPAPPAGPSAPPSQVAHYSWVHRHHSPATCHQPQGLPTCCPLSSPPPPGGAGSLCISLGSLLRCLHLGEGFSNTACEMNHTCLSHAHALAVSFALFYLYLLPLRPLILLVCGSLSSIPTLLECMQIVGTLSVLLILFSHPGHSSEDALKLTRYLANV